MTTNKTMQERFDENTPPRGMHTSAGDFDKNGESKVYKFGYKKLIDGEVFTVVDWDNIKSFIQSEIDLAVAEDRERIIEMLEKTKLPQNTINGGMTTLMYIPDEGFNIEVNKRLDWVIDLITKNK